MAVAHSKVFESVSRANSLDLIPGTGKAAVLGGAGQVRRSRCPDQTAWSFALAICAATCEPEP